MAAKITTNGVVEATRHYDGNGREAKRDARNYIEEPSPGYWTVKPAVYYIRSSVLGNEVLSEVDSVGKRTKGYVRAAGTTLATQTGDPANSQYQYVYFETMDASAMSYRATTFNGTPILAEGYDGSPAESDPLGNNAGLFNPYYELDPPPIEPAYPTLETYNQFDNYRVNGQSLTCNLDGIAVGCGLAFASLANGSANINFTNTSSGILSQLGIFAVFHPNSGRTRPDLPGTPDDGTIRVNTQQDGGRYEYYFSGISWSPQQQTQPQQTDRQIVRQGLDSFLKNDLGGDCAVALKALKVSSPKLLEAFDKAKFVASPKKAVDSASTSFKLKGPITSIITTNSGIKEFLDRASAGFLIHELVHAVTKRNDEQIYRALVNAGLNLSLAMKVLKTKRLSKNVPDYSTTLSNFFNENCVSATNTPDEENEE